MPDFALGLLLGFVLGACVFALGAWAFNALVLRTMRAVLGGGDDDGDDDEGPFGVGVTAPPGHVVTLSTQN